MKAFIIGLFLTISTLGVNLQAAEGFHDINDFPSLAPAWNSTYAIIHRNEDNIINGLGTGFVIDKFSVGNRYFVIMMTAAHVIDDFANPNTNTSFTGLQIIKDFRKKVGPDFSAEGVPLDGVIMTSSMATGKDVGSLLIEVREPLYPTIKPLEISQRGCASQSHPTAESGMLQATFMIGFPAVHLRTEKNQNAKIDEPDTVKKRFSAGFLATGFASGNQHNIAKDLLWSTADTLEGASGGPITDQDGDWMGVVVGARYVESSVYKSNEKLDPQLRVAADGYSIFVGCAVAQGYAEKIKTQYRKYIN